MTAFVTAADVRGYLNIEGSTKNYSTGNLESNIRAASSFLQRETNRQFEAQTGTTKTFSTDGKAYITIPDLRTVTSATLQGVALTANTTYWLHPDRVSSGVYTGLQVRAFGSRGSYLSNPEWFDRNLDTYARKGWDYSTLPNDLVIVGDWGYTSYPDELMHATKVLAGFYSKRPDSVLANAQVTPEGALLSYSDLPLEVGAFIRSWRLGESVALI